MNAMRLLFVTTILPPEAIGGAEAYALGLAERLRSLGAEVDVVGRRGRGPLPRAEDGVVRLGAPGHEYFGYLAVLAAWLRTHACEYDALQFFDFNHTSAIGLAATRRCGTPRLLRDEQELRLSEERLRETSMPGLYAMSRRWLSTAEQVVYVSTSEADALGPWGYGPDRRTYVPNGIDATRYPVAPFCEQPTLVCPARFRPEKNHDGLLRAFALARASVPDARLVLAGDGPLEPSLRRQAAEMGLGESVRFLGYVDSMAPVFASARACVLLSHVEGPALGVLEAACAGRPAIVSTAGGLRDSVKHGITGFHADGGDEEIATRMVELLTEDALARRMGDAAARFVRQERDIDVLAETYLAILSSAVASVHRTRERTEVSG